MLYKILAGFLFISLFTFAEKPAYLINEIEPALKANAHTVYRELKYNIDIKSENSATIKVTEVRSILNKNGEHDIVFFQSYNPMNKITSLRGQVYDENGKKVRTIASDEAYDLSNMGYSLYDENRVRILDPKYLTYPMTVKYEYELLFKQTLFLPALTLAVENTSFENIEYTISFPKDFELKYKEYNLPANCIKSTDGDRNILYWKMSNIAAKTNEPYSPVNSPNDPAIRIVPKNFMVESINGSTSSWKDFGNWTNSLLKDKDILPETTIAKIKELTSGMTNDFDKVKAVYEFMQKKTRYVSVQIGIGGWQPFGADIVDKNSYGDCKALSNYTKALLTAAGVKSNYILVKAGSDSEGIDTSFVSSQFNHAIVCVPIGKDTIWLETTDQMLPCGFNSDFTDDRFVLLVDNDNSRLIRTRSYSMNENCISRNATVTINADNSGSATVKTRYIGLCYGDKRQLIVADNNVKKQMISESISIPSFKLNNFTIEEKKAFTPEIEENLSLDLSNYLTSINGNIHLLPLNLMNKFNSVPDKVRNRKNAVEIRRSYLETDTITYQLPASFKISTIPENINVNTAFGQYEAKIAVNGNNVTYYRRFSLLKGIHPASEYVNFREFLENVKTQDGLMLSIQKN